MKKHLPKLLWTLIFVFGILFLVYGFSSKDTKSSECEESRSEKCSYGKAQSDLNVKNFSHHLLDFIK